MKRWIKWIGRGLAALSLAGAVAYAATPGRHRALTPGVFGLARVAPNLHIDFPGQVTPVLALIAKAEAKLTGFLEPLRADPTFVVGTTDECRDPFALRPNGLAVGRDTLLIGPDGLNETIVTHERVHAELRSQMGLRDNLARRFPVWFDEGLASHPAPDPRHRRPADPRDADRIRQALSSRGRSRLHRSRDDRDTYGAAARLVQELCEIHGSDAMRTDFDATLAALAKRARTGGEAIHHQRLSTPGT